jgi:hypothetical protein
MICPLAWAALLFKWVPQKIHNGRSKNLYKALVTVSVKHSVPVNIRTRTSLEVTSHFAISASPPSLLDTSLSYDSFIISYVVTPAKAGVRAPGSRRDLGGDSPPPGDARVTKSRFPPRGRYERVRGRTKKSSELPKVHLSYVEATAAKFKVLSVLDIFETS